VSSFLSSSLFLLPSPPLHVAVVVAGIHNSLTVLVMIYACLHTKTGDCYQRHRHRTEGDVSGNLRLGKLLPGSPEDLRFRAFFDVSAHTPTPKFLHFFMGTHIRAHISRKQHHSHKFARGVRSQYDEQVYLAVHPVNICVEQMVGKLIVLLDFIE